jgi:hypothetical protein
MYFFLLEISNCFFSKKKLAFNYLEIKIGEKAVLNMLIAKEERK